MSHLRYLVKFIQIHKVIMEDCFWRDARKSMTDNMLLVGLGLGAACQRVTYLSTCSMLQPALLIYFFSPVTTFHIIPEIFCFLKKHIRFPSLDISSFTRIQLQLSVSFHLPQTNKPTLCQLMQVFDDSKRIRVGVKMFPLNPFVADVVGITFRPFYFVDPEVRRDPSTIVLCSSKYLARARWLLLL